MDKKPVNDHKPNEEVTYDLTKEQLEDLLKVLTMPADSSNFVMGVGAGFIEGLSDEEFALLFTEGCGTIMLLGNAAHNSYVARRDELGINLIDK